MQGLARSVGFALLVLSAAPAPAHAWGWSWRHPGTRSYYYATPVVYAPAYGVVPFDPCLNVPQPIMPQAGQEPPLLGGMPTLARPQPAPASSGPVAPQTSPMNKVPAVNESRSFFDAYAVAPRPTDKPAKDRAEVGFWNLSGHDLTLKVAGQTHRLEHGKNLKLQLNRQFVWRVEDREAQSERVPDEVPGLDIVIRH
jgi:hypothetical protein